MPHHIDYDGQDSWQIICRTAQSPIDIDIDIDIELARAAIGDTQESQGNSLAHTMARLNVIDNGHAVEIKAKGPGMMIRGRHFLMEQFHFHAKSEHTINGKHYPLEGHFVFKARDGRLAVVGVMYKEGDANPLAEQIINAVGGDTGGALEGTDIAALLPEDKSYFHYLGSLTTPPLTENVEWYVLEKNGQPFGEPD